MDTELHTYIVDDADEPVWFANDDSSTYIWRSGAGLIAVAAVPLLLGVYAFAAHSGPAPGAPWVFAITTLPIAAIALGTAVAYLVDRRRIVRMRLRTVPAGTPVLEMTRANGRDARYPLSAVSRIDIVREYALASSVAHRSTMVFLVAGQAERARPGPSDLPPRWVDALTAADVEMAVYHHHASDRPMWQERARALLRRGAPPFPPSRTLPRPGPDRWRSVGPGLSRAALTVLGFAVRGLTQRRDRSVKPSDPRRPPSAR